MRARTTFSSNSRNARETNPSFFFRIFKAACGQHLTAILFPIPTLHLVSPESNYCISISLSLLQFESWYACPTSLRVHHFRVHWYYQMELERRPTLGAFLYSNCCPDLLLIVIIQKKVQVRHWQCHICGRVLSRNSGLKRHMKTHNSDPTKFVLLFSNSLIIVIDTYLIANSPVRGMVATTELSTSSIWILTYYFGSVYYYSLSFLPLTDPSSLAPEIENSFVTTTL